MSQPRLVIDPHNVRLMAFNALHGGRGIHAGPPVDPNPPTERSRYNTLHEPHTTFKSADGQWQDNPYYAPQQFQIKDRVVYGEDNAAAIDTVGRVYLAGVFAYRDANDTAWRYAVILYKEARISEAYYYHEPFIIRAPEYNVVDSLHLLHVAETGTVLAVWRESKHAPQNASKGAASWISVYGTPTDGRTTVWKPQPSSMRIGPCKEISNPIAWKAFAYVACQPDAGYRGTPNASVDFAQIHAINSRTMEAVHVGQTPATGGHLLLVDQTNGHQILIASGADPNGVGFVQVSHGVLGTRWSDPEDYAAKLGRGGEQGTRLLEAEVTAAAFTKQTGYLHLLYLERYAVSPTDIGNLDARSLYKAYAVIRPDSGYQGKFDLRFGELTSKVRFQFAYQGGASDGIYRDLHDSIVPWQEPRTGKERLFVAFGDYGFIRFAEVVEINALPAFPLPGPSTPAIPIASPGTDPMTTQLILGALTGLMLLRLLTGRRKLPFATPTQGR